MSGNLTTITFKADRALENLLKGISNRSEFIRVAILNALNSLCPLCKGTGVLTPKKKEHWEDFSKTHPIKECGHCDEIKLVCRESA